jgi:hypothetical protein
VRVGAVLAEPAAAALGAPVSVAAVDGGHLRLTHVQKRAPVRKREPVPSQRPHGRQPSPPNHAYRRPVPRQRRQEVRGQKMHDTT